MRKIHRGGEEQPVRPVGRKVNVSQSRREARPAAEKRTRAPKAPKSPKPPKEKSKHPILRFIGRTLATVLCLGIMLGSVVAVGMVFYVVQATANDGDLLDLDNIQLSQSSMVVATDPDTGAQVEYATLRSSNSHRVWADLEQIPSNLQYAFICTEDKDFYSEPGVNFKRTIGAMINEYLLPIYSSKQGASTLEQQLIKNLTDDNSASGINGALRKVREIYRALCLSRSYSKETILEAYLNTISFTGTIQGVQTAANEYFNKDVSQLSLWECATIASITKNPTNYNPYTNPENLINRRNFIMYNMWQQGVISEEDYRNGAAQPLVLAEEDSGKKPSTVTSYFTDALFNEVVQDIMTKEGISESEAQKLLYTGGFTIEATVNTKLQSQMENLMLNTDDAYFPAGWHEEEVTSISDDDVQVFNEDGTPKTRTGEDGTVYYYRNVRTQAAMVTLDYDGNVLAIAGGLGEKTKSLSLNRAYNVERQTGSTIKPIGAYALGIEYGLVNWSTMLNNSPLYQKQDMIIRDEDYCRKNGLMGLSDKQLRAYPNAWRSWPRNYGGSSYAGPETLRKALVNSHNTAAAQALMTLVGVDNSVAFLHAMGIDDAHIDATPFGLSLGSSGITPMQMAVAFGVLANGGVYQQPISVLGISDSTGKVIWDGHQQQERHRVFSESTAYMVVDMLKQAVSSGTGTNAKIKGQTVAGKTGTNSDQKGVFFAGMTGYYSSALWVGHDNYKALSSKSTGSRSAAPLWQSYMSKIHQGLSNRDILEGSASDYGLVKVTTCAVSGQLATDACRSDAMGYGVVTDYWKAGTEPTVSCQMHTTQTICSVSGLLASPYCPDTVTRGVLTIPSGHPLASFIGTEYEDVLIEYLGSYAVLGASGTCPYHTSASSSGSNTMVENTLIPDAKILLSQAYAQLQSMDIVNDAQRYSAIQSAITNLEYVISLPAPTTAEVASAMGQLTQAMAGLY